MNTSTNKSAKPGRHRVAWIVNMGVNPLTVAPLLMGLVAAHNGLRGSELSGVLFVAIVGYTILPLGFLLWLKQTGRIASIEARNQQQRIGPLWIGAGLLTIAGALVVWRSGTGYSPLLVVSLVFVVNAVLAAVINLRFKMSLHVSSVAGLFSILSALTWISGRYMPGGLTLLIVAGLLIPLLRCLVWRDHSCSRADRSGCHVADIRLMHASCVSENGRARRCPTRNDCSKRR